MSQNVVIVTGPTASGKSALGFDLLQQFDAEIINGDSVQIYRDFTIGSCKPTEQELSAVAHHLYSAIDPTEHFDAAQFVSKADAAITEIAARGRLPVVVGGTGLYLRSLLCGLVPVEKISAETKQEVAAHLAELREKSADETQFRTLVHQWFKSLDPRMAERLHPADLQRMRRAAEVLLGTGCSLADLQDRHLNSEKRYRALVIVLLPERSQLYEAIDARVDTLFEQGLIAEVQALQERYSQECQPFASIGYRHVCEYLAKQYDFEEMVRLLKRDTRRFAKRQMTWWRNEPAKLGWSELRPVEWKAGDISEQIAGVIRGFLNNSQDLSKPGIAFLAVC